MKKKELKNNMKHAYLCSKCLRECKQSAECQIISCHSFKEQLVLNFKRKKKRGRKYVKL
ncbi:MAG: hypothetical protein ACQESP_01090 [Candidatus Muiribacteriota bacterium]